MALRQIAKRRRKFVAASHASRRFQIRNLVRRDATCVLGPLPKGIFGKEGYAVHAKCRKDRNFPRGTTFKLPMARSPLSCDGIRGRGDERLINLRVFLNHFQPL